MNTHPGKHKEQPCILEHSYYCASCGDLFTTDGNSQWRHPLSGKVFASLYWPACSFTCYSREHGETVILETALERGDTSIHELESLFGYIAEDGFIETDLGDLVQ